MTIWPIIDGSSAELVGAIARSHFFQENPDRIHRMFLDGQDKPIYYIQIYTFIILEIPCLRYCES